jgi:hypothetical protein
MDVLIFEKSWEWAGVQPARDSLGDEIEQSQSEMNNGEEVFNVA